MNKEKRDWKKIVDESNGQLMFVPDKFIPAVEAWLKLREEVKKIQVEAAKLDFRMTTDLHNFILAFREEMENRGIKDIWTSDVGIEMNAAKEGVLLFTILQPK